MDSACHGLDSIKTAQPNIQQDFLFYDLLDTSALQHLIAKIWVADLTGSG